MGSSHPCFLSCSLLLYISLSLSFCLLLSFYLSTVYLFSLLSALCTCSCSCSCSVYLPLFPSLSHGPGELRRLLKRVFEQPPQPLRGWKGEAGIEVVTVKVIGRSGWSTSPLRKFAPTFSARSKRKTKVKRTRKQNRTERKQRQKRTKWKKAEEAEEEGGGRKGRRGRGRRGRRG